MRGCVDATHSRIPEVHVGPVAHGDVSGGDAVVAGAADEFAEMVHPLARAGFGIVGEAHSRSSVGRARVDGVDDEFDGLRRHSAFD